MTNEENVFKPSEEVLKAAESALATIHLRPSAQRHPMGKMINCKVCGERHRELGQTTYGFKKGTVEQITTRCVQKFTNHIGDYELLKEQEDADGNITLVPDYRTAAPSDGTRPTAYQVVGRPRKQEFSANRIKVHLSKMKLRFVEETRKAFADLGFDIEETDKEKHGKNLQAARELAGKRIRAAHKAAKTSRRARAEHSRRINAGLENNGTRWYNRDRVGA